MIRKTASICIISLLGLFFLVTSTAFAQGNLGAITGTSQDSSGGVVPDLPLIITNVETGVKWTATTSSAGYYRIAVPPGTYRLEAGKQGFKTQVTDNIIVPVAQVVTVDFTLQVGSQSETIEVNSAAPLLTPSTAEVSSAVTAQEFRDSSDRSQRRWTPTSNLHLYQSSGNGRRYICRFHQRRPALQP